MVEHSIPALEVVLIFIAIYQHIYFNLFIENSEVARVESEQIFFLDLIMDV